MELTPYKCESLNSNCDHAIPVETFTALEQWRSEHGDDGLYVVRSECAESFKVLQRYGNYCVIEDKKNK